MKKQKLSKEEQLLEDSFDSPQWKSVSANELKTIENAARRSVRDRNKVDRASVRFSHDELEDVKRKAAEQAIDYHAWIRSIAVRAARGQLVDISTVKSLIRELAENPVSPKKRSA